MNYDYVTYNNGAKYGFKVNNNKVYVYINDIFWGVPQGSRFIGALLRDLKEGEKSEYSSNRT